MPKIKLLWVIPKYTDYNEDDLIEKISVEEGSDWEKVDSEDYDFIANHLELIQRELSSEVPSGAKLLVVAQVSVKDSHISNVKEKVAEIRKKNAEAQKKKKERKEASEIARKAKQLEKAKKKLEKLQKEMGITSLEKLKEAIEKSGKVPSDKDENKNWPKPIGGMDTTLAPTYKS